MVAISWKLLIMSLALLAPTIVCQYDELEITLEGMADVLPIEELAKAQKPSVLFSDALPIKKLDDYFRIFEKVTSASLRRICEQFFCMLRSSFKLEFRIFYAVFTHIIF